LPDDDGASASLVQSISDNLGAFFRHLLPGIVIMGASFVAHPCWFSGIDTHSWQHILIVAVVALASGNLWFAFNRYVIHQFVDYLLYLFGGEGPAPTASRLRYTDDLGKYVAESLCTSEIPSRARQHVAFRASSILLLYTVAEIGALGAGWHEPGTLFAQHPCWIYIGSFLIFAAAIWQNIIARRVDYYVIGRKKVPPQT
jgi:hypothetical protein